jgi:hypothetical protein
VPVNVAHRASFSVLLVDDGAGHDAWWLRDQVRHSAREPLKVSAGHMALMIGGRRPALDPTMVSAAPPIR